MKVKKEIQDELIATAERMIFYNNGIIEMCENWLPAEEANANMMREIEERQRKEKEQKKILEKQKKPIFRFWKWINGETGEIINN